MARRDVLEDTADSAVCFRRSFSDLIRDHSIRFHHNLDHPAHPNLPRSRSRGWLQTIHRR